MQNITISNQQKTSFLDGGYTKIVLPIGTKLWRFVSAASARYSLGEYWIDDVTMKEIMQILHCRGDFSNEFKKELTRDNLAIMERWSRLNCRQQIILRKDVTAYKGIINRQLDVIKENGSQIIYNQEVSKYVCKMRAGGYIQYLIPHFPEIKKQQEKEKWVEYGHFASLVNKN